MALSEPNKSYEERILDLLFLALSLGLWFIGFLLTSSDDLEMFGFLIMIVSCVCAALIELWMTNGMASPFMFWILMWLGAITAARYPQGKFFFSWSSELSYIVLGTAVIFPLCYTISHLYFTGRTTKRHAYCDLNGDIFLPDRLKHVVLLIIIVGIVSQLLNFFEKGFVPLLVEGGDSMRVFFTSSVFFTVANSCRIVLVYVPIVIRSENSRAYKTSIVLLTSLYLILFSLTGWRGLVLSSLLFVGSSFLLTVHLTKKRLLKVVLLSLIIVVIVFAGVGMARLSTMGYEIGFSDILRFTAEYSYLYIAPNFLNMQNAISTIEPSYRFVHTTEAIWSPFIDSRHIDSYQSLSFFTGGFNVSTYMLQPFADYGALGVFAWTAIIAVVAAYGFSRLSPFGIRLYIVASSYYVIFYMHNGFVLRSTVFILWFLIAAVINHYSLTTKHEKQRIVSVCQRC